LDVLVARARTFVEQNQEGSEEYVNALFPAVRASLAAADMPIYQPLAEEPDIDEDEQEDLATCLIKLPNKRRRPPSAQLSGDSAKKRRRTNSVLVAHPACKLIGHIDFVNILKHLCNALSKHGRDKEACEVVQQIERWGPTSKHAVQVDDEESLKVLDRLRSKAAILAFNADDFHTAYKFTRSIVTKKPHSFADVHFLNRIVYKLEFHNKCKRFIERLLKKNPSSTPLRVLCGHFYMVHLNFDGAIDQYLRALANPKYKDNSTLHLFLGIASIQQAMKKSVADRHLSVMRSFAYLFHYYDTTGDAEACYNVARGFHYIGLTHLAVTYYNKCHERATQGDDQLKREAAHNLATIYLSSGSPELARRLYMEYVTI